MRTIDLKTHACPQNDLILCGLLIIECTPVILNNK